MKKFIYILCFGLVLFVVGLGVGWGYMGRGEDKTVSSQVIFSALRDRGFLVTQTNVLNEQIKIEDGTDNFWHKLFWGQAILAYGVAEVNLGVDLSKINEKDVEIDGDKITVRVPAVEIFNSRVVGDINLENKQGILKRIFENSDGYNEATAELIKEAEKASRSEVAMQATNAGAKEEIKRIVGYIAPGKNIEIVFK